MIYDWGQVPKSAWEDLGHELAHDDRYSCLRLELLGAIQRVLSAAQVKRRTRAEVDAEIAKLTRACVEAEWADDDSYERWEAVTKLCREPLADPDCPLPTPSATAQPGPTGAASEGSRDDRAAPGEATSLHHSSERAPRTAGARTPGEPPEESVRAGGGSHPDDRPCGCEETVALREVLEEIREQFEGWRDHCPHMPKVALTAIGKALERVPKKERA